MRELVVHFVQYIQWDFNAVKYPTDDNTLTFFPKTCPHS